MSQQDFSRALEALQNESARAEIERGDLSALQDLDLTEDERLLVLDASSDLPEVAGFAMGDLFGTNPGKAAFKIEIEGIKGTAPIVQEGLKRIL